jgi:mRNA interferase RelE/StbE
LQAPFKVQCSKFNVFSRLYDNNFVKNDNLDFLQLSHLKKISDQDRRRMHIKIQELNYFPNVTNCKKLTNFEPAYRMRVGNYRILFDVIRDEIQIGRILHRKDSYIKS